MFYFYQVSIFQKILLTLLTVVFLAAPSYAHGDHSHNDNPDTNIDRMSACPSGVGSTCRHDISPSCAMNSTIYDAEDFPDLPIKNVKLVFHIFQQESPLAAENFENNPSHINYLMDYVHHPALGINAINGNLCNPDADLTDSRIRFALTENDIIFHQNNDFWNNGHFYCRRPNGSYVQDMDRQCAVYEEVVNGATGNATLTASQKDAIHVLFIERSELSDGRDEIAIGGFANSIGAANGKNFVVLTSQYFEYFDRNNLELSDKTAKRFAHEIALLMGAYHDFGDATNLMSHENERCLFDLKDLRTFHYYLEGNGCNGEFLTIDQAICPVSCESSGDSYVIRSGQNLTWTTDLNLSGGLVVESGASLTIFDCEIKLPADAIIQVEVGAQLIIQDATISSICANKRWEHIEINGNPALSQNTSNQGKLILNNSTLENAKTGVLMDSEFNNGNMGGGILEATGSTFLNCKRGISFITYMSSNISYVDNCEFIIDNNFISPNNQAGQITMWQVKGIEIDNSNFNFSGPSADNQNGIHSAGSSFSATLNSFSGFVNGVYGNKAAKISLISLTGNNFFSNSIAMNMINGQNLNADCNRVFTDNSTGLFANIFSTINASDNYWGTSSGPSHPGNPSGTGVTIANSVSTSAYTPWLTIPFCKGKGLKNLSNSPTSDEKLKIYSSAISSSITIESSFSPIKRIRIFTIDGKPLSDESFGGASRKVEVSFPSRLLSGIYIILSETESSSQSSKFFVR